MPSFHYYQEKAKAIQTADAGHNRRQTLVIIDDPYKAYQTINADYI